jgi:UDP-glucose 4-epimerase
MKALITGASGFIAPHLIEACRKRGWDVIGVDVLPPSDYKLGDYAHKQMDVRDLTVSDLAGVDYVFHLAFVTNIPNSIQHPLETTNDNIDMTVYLLDLCAKAKVKRFVLSTTASLYGDNPTPWREDMPSQPIEPYSWQKLSCEYACQLWSRAYGLQTAALRLFQVFGENQRKDTAMAAFFRARREGKPITLTQTTAQSSFKTGQRDFIYVKDVAEAFCAAAVSSKVGKGEVVNIGTGKVRTMEDIANAIGGEIIFIPKRQFEVERHEADITRATTLLDWKPKVEVIDWLNRFMAQQKVA